MSDRLSSRERILAAIRREPVDYVPCCGFFNPLSAPQRRGYTWNFPWPEGTGRAEALKFQVETLGLDQVVPVGVGGAKSAPGIESNVWREGDVLHKAYSTPAGELHAAVRLTDVWPHGENVPFYSDFNVGHYVEPWIQTEQDLECLKLLQVAREVDEIVGAARDSFAGSKALADRYGLAASAAGGMGLTGAQHLFGVADLCMMSLDNPGLVDAYLEHEHQINLRAIEAAGELGVDIIRRNGFYETADFYGPAALDSFLTRRLNAEADAAHKHGMVVAYTAHTGVMPILDYLAALPFDSLMHIDIAFEGVDMYQVREKVMKDKSLWTKTHPV